MFVILVVYKERASSQLNRNRPKTRVKICILIGERVCGRVGMPLNRQLIPCFYHLLISTGNSDRDKAVIKFSLGEHDENTTSGASQGRA